VAFLLSLQLLETNPRADNTPDLASWCLAINACIGELTRGPSALRTTSRPSPSGPLNGLLTASFASAWSQLSALGQKKTETPQWFWSFQQRLDGSSVGLGEHAIESKCPDAPRDREQPRLRGIWNAIWEYLFPPDETAKHFPNCKPAQDVDVSSAELYDQRKVKSGVKFLNSVWK